MLSANFKPKTTAAASRGSLATAFLFYALVWQYLGIDTHAVTQKGGISIPEYSSSKVIRRLVL